MLLRIKSAKIVGDFRRQIEHLFGKVTAENDRVLYGGSVNLDNAMSYLQTAGVNGLLIGESSLDVYAFAGIIKKCEDMPSLPVKRGK